MPRLFGLEMPMRGCYPPSLQAPPLPHREVLQKKKSSIFCLYFILKATKPHNQPPSLQPPYIYVCGVGGHVQHPNATTPEPSLWSPPPQTSFSFHLLTPRPLLEDAGPRRVFTAVLTHHPFPQKCRAAVQAVVSPGFHPGESLPASPLKPFFRGDNAASSSGWGMSFDSP